MKIVKELGERLHLPRWIIAELRPILAFAGAGAALWTGTCELVRRGWTVLGRHFDRWERLGAVAVGGYVTVYACAHAPRVARFAIPVAAVAWCVAAWCVAPPALVAHEQLADEEPAASDPQDVYEATVEWIWRQIGDRQGVHLRDLLEHAQAHGMFQDLDVSTLRAHLERWGIPVRNRVRVRGLGVTVGVHRDDLPGPPQPSPESDGPEPPNPELHVA